MNQMLSLVMCPYSIGSSIACISLLLQSQAGIWYESPLKSLEAVKTGIASINWVLF